VAAVGEDGDGKLGGEDQIDPFCAPQLRDAECSAAAPIGGFARAVGLAA